MTAPLILLIFAPYSVFLMMQKPYGASAPRRESGV